MCSCVLSNALACSTLLITYFFDCLPESHDMALRSLIRFHNVKLKTSPSTPGASRSCWTFPQKSGPPGALHITF